jgi:uncharacterized coiled-coil protein SlyX
MINKIACCAGALLLSACGVLPLAPGQSFAVASPVATAAPAATPGEMRVTNKLLVINELLAYQAGLKRSAVPELSKSLQGQPGFEAMLRRAMLLAAQRGDGGLSRAQAQLDGVLESGALDAQHLKPLAQALAGHYAELRRQDAALDKLNAQLRDVQRRNEQLNGQLDALKNIERTLSTPPLK